MKMLNYVNRKGFYGFDSKQIAMFYCSILSIQIKHMSAIRTTKQIEAILVRNQMETCLHNGVKL